MDAVVSALSALDDFIATELQAGKEGIDEVKEILAILDSEVVGASVPVWPAIILAFPWVILPLFLSFGVFLAHKGKIKPSLEKFMGYGAGLLVLMTLTNIGLSVALSAYGIANAGM